MTKNERKKIIQAMWHLNNNEEDGGDYNAGMDILYQLAYDRKSLMPKPKDLKTVKLKDIKLG